MPITRFWITDRRSKRNAFARPASSSVIMPDHFRALWRRALDYARDDKVSASDAGLGMKSEPPSASDCEDCDRHEDADQAEQIADVAEAGAAMPPIVFASPRVIPDAMPIDFGRYS